MANDMIGYNFQPGQDSGMQKAMNRGPAQAGGNMANQALRVLSLRLPNMLGGHPLASRSLMTPGMGGNGSTTNNGALSVTGPGASSGLGAMLSGAVGGTGSGAGAPNFTPAGITNPNDPPQIVDNPGESYSQPYNPGGWTGPITGGITGGGNYGGGAPSIGNETQMPTMDMNLISGLMRLFGNRG